MPYHALTDPERDVFNARRALLEHLGHLVRSAAARHDRHRMLTDEQSAAFSESYILTVHFLHSLEMFASRLTLVLFQAFV